MATHVAGVLRVATAAMIGIGAAARAFAQPDAEHAAKGEAMIAKAMGYLKAQQSADKGGWAIPPDGPVYPAITGLVINGMLMQPGVTHEDESVAKGIDFMLRYRQSDGGIYDKVLPNYNTSLVVSALARVPREDAKAAVREATAFLRRLQWGEEAFGDRPSETGVVDESHPFFGGVGYGRHGRPDNSNLAQFTQAMHDAGVESSDAAFQRALAFLSRTQMLDATNDRAFADGSSQGGFVYATGVNKDRANEGQSFAGEIAESLSGPPGTVAFVTLRNRPDGSAFTLKPADIRRMIAETSEGSSRPHIVSLKDDALILLGQTADGIESQTFEIRTPIADAEQVHDFLFSALAGEVPDRGHIRVEPVSHWKGVSRLRAYGSMTYAGFKGLIYAGLERDDPRVVAAIGWIRANYTLRENPAMGSDGLYYYFVTFARAMDAWGEGEIEVAPASGKASERRNWANDLIDRLAELQNEDGSFQSVDDRWMENNPVLITAYGLLALQHAVR